MIETALRIEVGISYGKGTLKKL